MCVAQQCLCLNSVILLKVLSHVALFKKPCPGDHFVLWKKFNSDHSIPFSLSASVVYNYSGVTDDYNVLTLQANLRLKGRF